MNLIEESRNGNIENVKILLLNGADVNFQDKNGYTALIWASINGYLEVVKLLLLNGADVNIQTIWGDTALMFASCYGYLEVVKLLLLNGSDLNLQDEGGDVALTWATDHLKIVKLLTRANKMEEWRPWNHCNLSGQYQDAMSTLLLLAKI